MLDESTSHYMWQVPVKKAANESTAEAKGGAGADKAAEAPGNTTAEDAEVCLLRDPAKD